MSTRSMVRVISNNRSVLLYHHFDGYPEGVGMCLLKILNKYKQEKGCDDNSLVRDMVKKGKFEVTFHNHLDIEYYYELDFDKETVICKEVNNWDGDMKVIKTIDLKYDEEKDACVDTEIFEKEEDDV